MSDKPQKPNEGNEQLHNPVTEDSQVKLQGENAAETMHQHDQAGADISTTDWLSHMKTPANESGSGPIIREMPGYEAPGEDIEDGGAAPASHAANDGSQPKFDHKIKRNDNIGETMEAQAQMAVKAMEMPAKFGGWAITQDWDDKRTKMDDELKGFLVQVMKPVIAKRRNIFSDEVFFYAGILVYLVWCVSTLVMIWKDKKAQEAQQKEIKAKEAEIAALKAQLEHQASPQAQHHPRKTPPPPKPSGGLKFADTHGKPRSSADALYRLGGTPGSGRAVNRDKYLVDEDGKYCYPPIGHPHMPGMAKNGIISKDSRVGELRFDAHIDDMDYIVFENRIKKGEQKNEVAYNRVYKAFSSKYPSHQLDKLANLITFHIQMQQQYLGMR